ncbi:MAG: L-threonylcarbamoyladenylate synthase [Phycisphaerales bacterium]|jgi:L-threonylcarbamoyladenylate synthase
MTAVPGHPELAEAVERLQGGGLVAFPTETVYGLGADAFSDAAVEGVFRLKGRPGRNPLIVHVADVAMARTAVASWPLEAQRLAERYWPGPLTLVVPKADIVPPRVTAGASTVAVRCPDHPLTLALLRAFGRPLVGPSANPSGRVSPTAADHVRAYFAPRQVLVLDGGACRAGIESTVLSLADPTFPVVLRPGVISAAELAATLGRPVAAVDHHGAGAGPLAGPGMLPSHYAPGTPARLVNAAELAAALRSPMPRVAALAIGQPTDLRGPHVLIPMAADAPTYARNLYAALMRADAAGAERILIERPPTGDADPIWEAVLDRLHRATAPRDPGT